MGCCSSRLPSLYENEQPSASSAEINPNPAQPSNTRPSTVASSRPPGTSSSNKHKKPIKVPVWRSTSRTWTRTQLLTERAAFFDTRVTGRPEIWQAIHAALEVLWSGGGPDDHDGGLATATQILDAVEVIRPQGDLSDGLYDRLGNFYQLPKYVCCDPMQVVDTPRGSVEGVEEGKEEEDEEEEDEDDEEYDEEEVLKRREKKGKGIAKVQEYICVKARLSDSRSGSIDVKVVAGKENSVRLLRKKIFEAGGLTTPTTIRLFYMGYELQDTKSLPAQNWKDGHMITVMVFE